MARKAHVKRIFKIAVNPDTQEEAIVTDIWVDVLRLDRFTVSFRSQEEGASYQDINYVIVWNDDKDNPVSGINASNADRQFENANGSRKTEKLIISDPDVKTDTNPLPEGGSNSATSINDNDIVLWMIKKFKVFFPRGEGSARSGQILQFVFNNNPWDQSKGTPSNRTTSIIKVVNNDLGGMKMTREVDGVPQSFIMDWGTYQAALQDGKTDDKDLLYLVIEFPDDFTIHFGADVVKGYKAMDIKHVLTNNRAIENMFFAADQSTPKSRFIRADPLQFVVNVGSNIIAVEYAPEEQ